MRSATPRPEPGNTVAILVTYHPDEGLHSRIAPLQPQVTRLIVVDNGSGSELETALAPSLSNQWLEVIRNGSNLGIAAALNQGVALAASFEPAPRWVLTLDQDASVLPGFVDEAGIVYGDIPDSARVAVIGAQPVTGKTAASRTRRWAEVPVAITAGSLISMDAIAAIGGFRESFFMDYVDIDFCLKARHSGFKIISRPTSRIRHRIGEPTRRFFLYRHVTPTNHSATRRYYITRNRLHMWREYGRHEPAYVIVDMLNSLKELAKLVLFEDDRANKLRGVARGVSDALRGRSGSITNGR